MQKNIQNIDRYCLRKRIDGINLTLVKPMEELEILEGQELIYFQRNYIYEALAKLKFFFEFDLNAIEIVRTKAIVDLTDENGIYIELYFKNIDLFIILQFKGFFFTKEDSFEYTRALIVQISEKFEELLRVTTVDIAQDIFLPISEILPNPTNCPSDIRYCFKHTCRNNVSANSKGRINTGFEIFGGRFKLIVYDKKEENLKSKNPQKKEYYQKIFDQFPDRPVTRVELRLKQEACKKLIDEFYCFEHSEIDFINACLSGFYKKHKLRVKKDLSDEKDFRRWPVHSNWKTLFEKLNQSSTDAKTSPNFLYTSRSKEIGKAMKKLLETVVNSYPEKGSDELFKELFELKYKEVIEESKKKIILREESKRKLQSRRLEVFAKFHKTRLSSSAEGQVGIPIISPLERMPFENLDTCERDL